MPSKTPPEDNLIIDDLLTWQDRLLDFFLAKPTQGPHNCQDGFSTHMKCTLTVQQTFQNVNFHSLILSHDKYGDFFILIAGPEQASPKVLASTMASWITTGNSLEPAMFESGETRIERNEHRGTQIFAHLVGEKVMFYKRGGLVVLGNEELCRMGEVDGQDSRDIGGILNQGPPLPIRGDGAGGIEKEE
ncbi:uncharacterized protein BO80DRAFT_431689 [Aspergillus ibericus CBS 121593]|uniref:Uncharacterized protein n=1 Tax=Aspergillus ibericus CBS 121593 TaxID=1448316 RepID=A0A395HBE1_9EURO|nr:hypothetical protein BO80DRAFT_431689 [Aspergillus ibericus CBS 121593]RAL05162.1 hypothetical protein BO80DRAFT_431689 [Aspergillus ibericus CBS 121593]